MLDCLQGLTYIVILDDKVVHDKVLQTMMES